MVSNTGSDYDENEGEFDADEGSDDWKPEPEVRNVNNGKYKCFRLNVFVEMAAA